MPGLMDIVAALTWVRDNISSFGGDPGNVTVFGQSGGGMKICALLAMPLAKGLFHKAIVQSGPRVRLGESQLSAKLAGGVLKELGLTSASDLHSVEFPRLRNATVTAAKYSDAPWPCVDGRILPAHPFDPAAPAISADVPLLIGTTLHEGAQQGPFSEAELKEQLRKRRPQNDHRIYDLLASTYPGTTATERLAIATSDYRRDSMTIARRKAALQAAPVHAYVFAWQTPILAERPARATHFMDLPFVFYNTDRCAHATGGTVEARRLAGRICDAWVSFARTGNPGHAGLPKWPALSASRDATMFFNDRCEMKFDHDRELLAAL
jgi:para-nitrobenzyl esterase